MRALGLLGVVLVLGAGCASASMAKEEGPTQITVAITSPAPGAELVAGGHATIAVTGTVATTTPARGALEAWVNGTRVDVKHGAFTAEVAAEPGVNHIKVEGGDGIVALVSQELDVMWVAGYLPPRAGQTGFDLPAALELQLGQRFFDARLLGTALDRSTNPVVARDVASVLELILWNVNLAGLLPPDGIVAGQGDTSINIKIPSITPSDIVVDARVIDGPQPAIALNIDLIGVFLAMTGTVQIVGQRLVVAGGLTADFHAAAQLTLGTGADGAIAVTVTGATAGVGALTPNFTGDNGQQLDGLITLGSSDFRALIDGLLAGPIPAFINQLPPLLQSLLGAADQLLANLSFTLDPGLGSPVMLQLGGHFGGLDIAAGATSGHVTVREDLSVQIPGVQPIHPASLGAPRLDTSASAPVLDTSGLHLGIHLDFLNALLHALWNAGLLEGQLTSAGLTAHVSAKLPPLVRPTPASSACKIDGERCDVQLQLGQVQIELPSFEQSFVIEAAAGARIKITGNTVSLAIQMTPDLRVWETSAMPGGPLTPDAVSHLISGVVWPQLFGAIGSNLTFQLPLPDLASLGLGDLAPALANAQLSLQAGPRPTVTPSQLVLGADLVLATPAH
ncbi:MAG TPA: hypothetical protein VF516_21650 [Kofleriaceae bacterium]